MSNVKAKGSVQMKKEQIGDFENTKRNSKRFERWRIMSFLLVIYDIIAIALSFFLALWFRYDCNFSAIPSDFLMAYCKFIGIYVVFCLLVFWRFKLYNSIWRFAGFAEILKIIFATVIAFVFHCIFITVLFEKMPLAYYLFGILIQFVLTLFIRFSGRFAIFCNNLFQKKDGKDNGGATKNIMLIGAGEAGQLILHDIQKMEEIKDSVKCIIDDDPDKWGRFIEGVPVEGGREKILSCVEKYNISKIFLVIPSISLEEKKNILEICKKSKCELKELPSIFQLYNGEISLSKMKDVAVEDLLGRKPIQVDMRQIFEYLSGKVIFISGAGGSIGREISLQVAAHEPKLLILFDFYENNLYDIQFELKNKYPALKFIALIGSVRDSRKLNEVFSEYKPEVVFHAAAHKHVPLMEDSPCEAIKNNAIGTYKTAYAAALHGCKRFVLISTDKAVNPTNIMGASKRLCEMIIQSFDRKIKDGKMSELPLLFTHSQDEDMREFAKIPQDAKTEFVAVRFGNVLGSNGSVIPLFKKQIANGGPVTVTHPDIVRYFMTIPEAVSLVLQAATYAHGGEIFVLDMGEPVKIDTLARNLIRLSGYEPDKDIKIVYSGLRPGEKLYEEKLMSEEGLKKTPNDMIHIGSPIPFDSDKFLHQLGDLMQAAYDNREDIRELVAEVVTTYHIIDVKKDSPAEDETVATDSNISQFIDKNTFSENSKKAQ